MPENIFFTSDNHFNHKKIMEYEKRPFITVEDMNEYMIDVWNKTITKNDRVYHMGDFSFHDQLRIAKRLNGRKFLIIGNHDYVNKETSSLFEWVGSYKKIKVGEQVIVMCHYPFKEWEMKRYGSWNLFGHCHGNLKVGVDPFQLDVGVDSIGYVPKEFSEIKRIFENK